MPSLSWYLRRLRGMSPAEIGWRLRSTLRDVVDRPRLALGLYPAFPPAPSTNGGAEPPSGFSVSDLRLGEWASVAPCAPEATWRRRLVEQADRIVEGRLSFFNLHDRYLGNPIDWNCDHDGGQAAPLRFAPSIDYRAYRVTGDAKVVWEPNRHHHLVVLGRAYRATGDVGYAAAAVAQLESWWRQCPVGMGMNWRSPLELAIRLINWVWTIGLIRDSGLVGHDFRARLLEIVYLHLWEITRKYSRGSSANNHRIGEAAGVFIATSYFRELDARGRWRDQSRAILAEEIGTQTYPDGGSREQALGYHLFVLQFFLIAGVVARWGGDDFSAAYWSRLERMLEFAGALTEGGDTPPMFGDADDGYVLDLGSGPGDVSGLLSVGAILFGRSDFKAWAGGYAEPARWLLGRGSRAAFDAIPPAPADSSLASRAFRESGYYVLQCGRRGTADRVSVFFDCGELGFESIAAHGHADALSFTLRAFGCDVFLDPGTYDYFTFPAWRNYFRGTRAHNTIVIDDADQSSMLGAFLWGARARARCLAWEPRADGGTVVGEHDGYTRLPDPLRHRRTLDLDGASRILSVQDDLLGSGRHSVAMYFHLAEDCVLSEVGPNRYQIAVGGGAVTLEVDRRLTVQCLRGSEHPIGGWVSRGYHRKTPTTTLVASGVSRGNVSLVSRVLIGSPR
jgi:Heparinase II/III-like protein/Heparinase II/III N-terminus